MNFTTLNISQCQTNQQQQQKLVVEIIGISLSLLLTQKRQQTANVLVSFHSFVSLDKKKIK